MDTNSLHILIADDDQGDRYQIKRLLKQSGLVCECTEVVSIELALKACDNAVFHCLIIDYQLPGQNGLAGIVMLHKKFPGIPIIMLTGQGNEMVAVEAMKCGASDYLLKKDLTVDLIKKSIINILEKSQLEKKLNELNVQLLEYARRAGMSEVAASVLHNIGNILNSANVSLVVIQEKITDDRLLKLKEIATLLESGVEEKKYILSDEKGKLIPDYLSKLSDVLLVRQKEIAQELTQLDTHLQHINSIVLMQNDIAGFEGVIEQVSIEELLNQAIQLSYQSARENAVQITQRLYFKDDLKINKAKTLQILVNLLNNAKQAFTLNPIQTAKKIDIETRQSTQQGFFEIQVSDNGMGIEKESMSRIFSMGYTTKKNGHGLGLHMSAISAHELGGKIMVESPGLNQGAVFTLTLPIMCINGNQKYKDN